MKRTLLWVLTLFSLSAMAQVTTIPAIVQKGYQGEITIIFNPNEGNKGMASATQCYAHTGITIGTTAWQKAGTWRDGKAKYKMTKNSDGNWELAITPNMYEYYGVSTTTDITQLCFVFNDGPNGSLEGKSATGGDIFVDLAEAGLQAQIQSPQSGQLFFANEQIDFVCNATQNASLSLTINNEIVAQADDTTELTYSFTPDQAMEIEAVFTATDGEETKQDEIDFIVSPATQEAELPEGVELGINYDEDDDTKVILCTFAAANKVANNPNVLVPAKAVYVIGDFNNWTVSSDYQMYRDSCHFWIELDNLIPRREYAYQYVVVRSDGVQKTISDGFAHKQLHPDDQYEPKTVDPAGYIAYPRKADGSYVSVLQTDQVPYEWSDATLNFVRPDKNNLIIYELWVYDFSAERSYEGVMNRLDYLQNLGVNAIEFMPIHEFDGNYNWGYSPNHYFAADKAYGSADMFKELIDSIHGRGMAVIVDMVFNHATGNNPQNKLYPYGDDLKYNPWFNVNPPHSDTYYEDWNHDFPETRKMFTRCLNYWLDEFKVDGFRMDLSHGFCGKKFNPYTNISHYYQNAIVPHNAYFILEHWGSDGHTKYIQDGMLCWTGAGLSNAYSQLAMGYFSSDNLSDANKAGYVSYAESHDEERNFYKAKAYGVSVVKDNENIRLDRVPLVMAFNVLPRGSHMLWQYEELGYDYSINSTLGSSSLSDGNRTAVKERPDRLGWFGVGKRMQIYQRVAQIIRFRTQVAPHLFEGAPKTARLASGKLRSLIWGNDDDQLVVVGNFSATDQQKYDLPAGVWYDYLRNELVLESTLTLEPGELRMFTSKQYPLPIVTVPYSDLNDLLEVMDKNNLPAKFMVDGQVYIVRNGVIYDLMGRVIR